jgi:putative peptide zinc metalloprotease protein
LKLALNQELLAPSNLVIAMIAFLVMKAFHELGHGLAVKSWGGGVRDMGIVLLVFLPVPYVDASSASAFPEKRRRVLTAAAGIMVELLLAGIAFVIWAAVEPGAVRQVALNVFLIGSISTLLFNGNPLLRFDGYYVLADALEIPNLAGRARIFMHHALRRVLLGERGSAPAQDRREACWLGLYGLSSSAYRLVLLLVIAFYLADAFFLLGMALACWVVATQLLWPLVKGFRYVADSSRNYLQRTRVVGVLGLTLAATYAVGFVVPVPSNTPSDGIVWMPDEAMVRVETDCFVRSVKAESGAFVGVGSVLMSCENPDLLAERDVLEARVGGLRMKYRGLGLREQFERRALADEIAAVEAELARVRERIDGLTVVSPTAGTFVRLDKGFLPGRFFSKGDTVGFVLADSHLLVKAAVRQEDIDLVSRHRSVTVRFAAFPDVEHEASLLRQVPAATRRLPSAALGSVGGGSLAVDPEDTEGRLAAEEVYLIDLVLKASDIPALVGLRAHVLFSHGTTVLADVLKRKLRLLFMRHVDV